MFIVYGVTRKLAHDIAAAQMKNAANKHGMAIFWDTQAAKDRLAELEAKLYASLKPKPLNEPFADRQRALEYIALAKNDGRDFFIKQRYQVKDERDQPVLNKRGKPITATRLWVP
jgi:hypothetical protein